MAELLERCRACWGTEPQRALLLSELALTLVEYVSDQDPLALCAGEKPDLRARAWAFQGNVRRLQGDLRQAEVCLAKAKRALAECWFDGRVEAEVLRLRACLLRAQRRFGAAHAMINRAIEIYQAYEDHAEVGKALLVRATVLFCCKDYTGMERDLAKALPLLDLRSAPRLEFVVANLQLNAAWYSGRLDEATALLIRAAALSRRHGTERDRLRVSWCEAGIAAERGRAEAAESLYLQIRSGFIREDSAYDVALVTVDLAALLLDQSRWSEIRDLAAEALPLFQARDVHREALAAWRLFAEAARNEALERETVERMRDYLEKARLDPSYRFEP